MMKRGKFEISFSDSVGTNRPWWWVYKAPNGEIVCTSQMYMSEAGARKGIASVKRGGLLARVVLNT